ncbi:hypothetical protein DVA86_15335 [Streptomyces armeniacus]|uniref:Uncharacterized protein n=1 Tax=Streptomyces armeniacus TaxID=83291 RepID=A0A345XQB1_9ACTN|nr:hypothetical protein [Streptomyces armeniacus]AXK33827.1 hypothetical protein DVA86_15335 [Streptomyces armeniacus]
MSATQSSAVQLLPLAKELDENKVTPGVLGFLVFAVIGLAVWMLMKSMTKHMKRVDFEEAPEEPRKASGRPAAADGESGREASDKAPVPSPARPADTEERAE